MNSNFIYWSKLWRHCFLCPCRWLCDWQQSLHLHVCDLCLEVVGCCTWRVGVVFALKREWCRTRLQLGRLEHRHWVWLLRLVECMYCRSDLKRLVRLDPHFFHASITRWATTQCKEDVESTLRCINTVEMSLANCTVYNYLLVSSIRSCKPSTV